MISNGPGGRERLGIRAYARHRGCSQSSVQQAIKEGRIANSVQVTEGKRPKTLIDPAAADAEWEENTGEKRGDPPKGSAGTPAHATGEPHETFAEARRRKESFNADLAKLKLEQERGNLAPVAEVKRRTFELARITRDSVLSIPDRIAAEMAAESDAHRVHQLLRAELEESLREIANETKDEDA